MLSMGCYLYFGFVERIAIYNEFASVERTLLYFSWGHWTFIVSHTFGRQAILFIRCSLAVCYITQPHLMRTWL